VKILADECCDAILVSALRGDGHDVLYIKEIAPGSDDATVLAMAVREQRILLTEDKDFGELVVRLKMPAYGIVMLRLSPSDTQVKIARLRDLLQNHPDRLAGTFTVIDETRTRFRAL
jgi:predicted nuclease of predicted toxin-antitoxin system